MCLQWIVARVPFRCLSCFMRFHKMGSPHSCEFFSALLTGILRWLGVGKHKKPAIEDWHIDQILKFGKAARHYLLAEYCQAITIAMVDWQLFNRPQDFHNFQRCDYIRKIEGCKVLICKAKNDQKGVTRAPKLRKVDVKARCPVEILFTYFKRARIDASLYCNKLKWRINVLTAPFVRQLSLHSTRTMET